MPAQTSYKHSYPRYQLKASHVTAMGGSEREGFGSKQTGCFPHIYVAFWEKINTNKIIILVLAGCPRVDDHLVKKYINELEAATPFNNLFQSSTHQHTSAITIHVFPKRHRMKNVHCHHTKLA